MSTSNSSLVTLALGCFAVGALLLAGCKSEPEATTTTTGTTGTSAAGTNPGATFASVQPILQLRCVGCHTGAGAKEGVDLTSHENIMKGGKDGPIVVSGDPAKSLLVQVLRGSDGKPQMPPKQTPLTEDEIKSIEAWITAGAPG